MARHGHGKNAAFAIRDYYPYWKQRNERSQAGKLLLVDPSATDVIQIFFDDNVGYSQAHIVDARDSKTGKALPFSQVQGAHLLRVEPVNAILDAKYFVRCALCARWLQLVGTPAGRRPAGRLLCEHEGRGTVGEQGRSCVLAGKLYRSSGLAANSQQLVWHLHTHRCLSGAAMSACTQNASCAACR